MSEEKIVITGLGILSPNGVDKDTFRDGLRSGKSGVRRINRLESGTLQTKVAGFIDDAIIESLFLNKEAMSRLDRLAILSVITSQRAVADARLDEKETHDFRKGVLLGSSAGPTASFEEAAARHHSGKNPYIQPLQVSKIFSYSAAAETANRFGAHKLCQMVSCGCSSSLAALAGACRAIRDGAVDIVLVGGAESPLQPCLYRQYDALRILTRVGNDEPESASRPFAANRAGFVLAEAAGFIVLERESVASRRNADPYAEILGAGQTYDPNGGEDPDPGLMADCMEEALADSQLDKNSLEHIQAHANGAPLGDLAEARAIQAVFGDHTTDIPVSSIKSMTGHALGASGIVSLIAVLLGMRNGFIPPTINLDEPDPDILLDCVSNTAREQPFGTAMVNAFGLGGNNVSVVLKKI